MWTGGRSRRDRGSISATLIRLGTYPEAGSAFSFHSFSRSAPLLYSFFSALLALDSSSLPVGLLPQAVRLTPYSDLNGSEVSMSPGGAWTRRAIIDGGAAPRGRTPHPEKRRTGSDRKSSGSGHPHEGAHPESGSRGPSIRHRLEAGAENPQPRDSLSLAVVVGLLFDQEESIRITHPQAVRHPVSLTDP